jgi:hypothetical protein
MRPPHEGEALRLARAEFSGWRPGEVEVTDIRLDGEHPDTLLVIIFTHWDRPGCEFGLRFPMELGAVDDHSIDPEMVVEIAVINADEVIDAVNLGLPKDCQEGQVTWV